MGICVRNFARLQFYRFLTFQAHRGYLGHGFRTGAIRHQRIAFSLASLLDKSRRYPRQANFPHGKKFYIRLSNQRCKDRSMRPGIPSEMDVYLSLNFRICRNPGATRKQVNRRPEFHFPATLFSERNSYASSTINAVAYLSPRPAEPHDFALTGNPSSAADYCRYALGVSDIHKRIRIQ